MTPYRTKRRRPYVAPVVVADHVEWPGDRTSRMTALEELHDESERRRRAKLERRCAIISVAMPIAIQFVVSALLAWARTR